MTSLAIVPDRRPRVSPVTMPGAIRPALLDQRPLRRCRPPAASPLTSPTFWLAGLMVLPVAGAVRLARALG